ncbi:MAG: hypothetical protein ABIL58_25495, partial [Pseudomonadota bacterium]
MGRIRPHVALDCTAYSLETFILDNIDKELFHHEPENQNKNRSSEKLRNYLRIKGAAPLPWRRPVHAFWGRSARHRLSIFLSCVSCVSWFMVLFLAEKKEIRTCFWLWGRAKRYPIS